MCFSTIFVFFFCFLHIRYFLQPRDNGNKSLKPDDLGSLRLNVVYTEDHVFSSDYYSPLRDLLLKSADVEVICLHCWLFTMDRPHRGLPECWSRSCWHHRCVTTRIFIIFLLPCEGLVKLCISFILVFCPCRKDLYLPAAWWVKAHPGTPVVLKSSIFSVAF